jgi:hypothetical protein
MIGAKNSYGQSQGQKKIIGRGSKLNFIFLPYNFIFYLIFCFLFFGIEGGLAGISLRKINAINREMT